MQQFFNMMWMLMMAKFMLNDVPHAAGITDEPRKMSETTTVYLPSETQEIMLELLQREKIRWTRGVERGFDLVLRNGYLYAGVLRRGSRGEIVSALASTAPGFFHTHPMVDSPPYFSEADTVDIFLRRRRRLLGVGHPEYSTTMVSFIALTKAPPQEVIFEIIDDLPGILDEGVHIPGLEEYYTRYEFTLGTRLLSMEVLLEWTPPRLPPKWWMAKETLDEYLQRKLPKWEEA